MAGGPRVRGVLGALAGILLVTATTGCTRYVRIDDLAEEYYNLGNAFYALEEYQQAEDYYLRALELDPEFERAEFNLARALAEQERYSEALALLSELLIEDPDNLRLQEAIAYVQYRRGDLEAAEERYKTVLEQSPFRPDALYNLGLLLLEDGAEVEARPYLARAYEVSPEDPDVLYAYSEALFRTGRQQTGLSILDELRNITDLPVEYLRSAGSRYAEAEFYADALVLYDRLLSQSPEDAPALFAKARILLTAAEEGEAGLAALEDALEAGFSDVEAAGKLLAEPSLIRSSEVRRLFEEYGIGPLEEERGADEEDSPGETETSGPAADEAVDEAAAADSPVLDTP